MFVFASILVFLALPRFVASTKALYSDVVIYQLAFGEYFSEKTFLKAENNLNEVLFWDDSAYYWRQLSQLKFRYFLSYPEAKADIDENLVNIRATTDLALSMMPAAPYTWYDRALMDSMYPEMAESALTGLKMSVYVDRVNRNLIMARVLLLWQNMGLWDDESRSIFEGQLLLLWSLRRKQLVQVLESNLGIEVWLNRGLLIAPDELVKLNRILKKINRR